MGRVYRFLMSELAAELDEKLGLSAIIKEEIKGTRGEYYNYFYWRIAKEERETMPDNRLVELAKSKVDSINALQRLSLVFNVDKKQYFDSWIRVNRKEKIFAQANRVACAIAKGNNTLDKIIDYLSYGHFSRARKVPKSGEQEKRIEFNNIPDTGVITSAIDLLVDYGLINEYGLTKQDDTFYALTEKGDSLIVR